MTERKPNMDIKVTREMIIAARQVLFSWHCSGADDCIEEVYIAMEKVRQKRATD